jgi:hypothetical protein
MCRFFAMTVVLLGMVNVVMGAPESKPADSAKSPKETLKEEDAVARAGNVEQDLAFYRATNAQEKKLAQAIANADVALAKLQKVVEQKFGKELAIAVVHAASAQDVSDIDAATEKVDGDKAVIDWKRKDSQPLTMVKVDGKWKVSLSDLIQGMDEKEVNELIDAMRQLVTQIGFISGRVEQGKYRSGEGIRDRVQEITDQLFSGNQKGGAAT